MPITHHVDYWRKVQKATLLPSLVALDDEYVLTWLAIFGGTIVKDVPEFGMLAAEYRAIYTHKCGDRRQTLRYVDPSDAARMALWHMDFPSQEAARCAK